MHEYRQALMRLHQGDSEREIARSGLMGRAHSLRSQDDRRVSTLVHQSWLESGRVYGYRKVVTICTTWASAAASVGLSG